ncbi:hypothetical protein P8C59_005952 [Phyllachora maydis]|uniref:Uncharacterized protein n=1 Tax=Phyllachora maydis TaxID=1825666 RepID=A0AAD9MCS5_9PEZI|nr:hypothetical protein P8C59_005952 [Phyllachora maydis]
MAESAPGEDAISKGGHSLRKRARIDYTQELIDNYGSSAPTRESMLRRRNAGHATASDGLDEEYEDENDIPAPAGGVPEGVKKRLGVSRTRLGQGQNQVTSAPVQREDIEQGEEDTDEPVSGRKRRRGAALSKAPDRDAQDEMDDEEGAKEMPKAKRQRLTRMQAAALSKSSAKLGEITPGVFYKEAAAAAEEAAESRPPTPSSDNDAQMGENAESAYGLREKKKRNFAAENDPELETRAKKRARVSAQAASVPRERTPAGPAGPTKRQKQRIPFKRPDVGGDSRKVPPPPSLTSGLAASANVNNAGPIPAMGVPLAPAPPVPQAPYIHTFRANPSSASKASASGATPPAGTARYPKKTPKIKLVGNGAASGASSRSQTPIAGTQGPPPAAGSADDKPYNEMSKSEKMSASMKRRWAMGEMKGAVAKRKDTLAQKAKAKAAGAAPPSDGQARGGGAVGGGKRGKGAGTAQPAPATTALAAASSGANPNPTPAAPPIPPAEPQPQQMWYAYFPAGLGLHPGQGV